MVSPKQHIDSWLLAAIQLSAANNSRDANNSRQVRQLDRNDDSSNGKGNDNNSKDNNIATAKMMTAIAMMLVSRSAV